jgi:hypothetical protein
MDNISITKSVTYQAPLGLQAGDQTVTANVAGFQTASRTLIPVGN